MPNDTRGVGWMPPVRGNDIRQRSRLVRWRILTDTQASPERGTSICRLLALARVQCVSQSVAEQVERDNGQEDH